MSYQVMVFDNFLPPDGAAAARSGTFPTYEAAVSHCKRIVDEFLDSNWEPGISAEHLMEKFAMFGEDPTASNGEGVSFSGWDYAEYMSPQVCNRKESAWKTEQAWMAFLQETLRPAPSS
jgi:hypothetical protein